MRKMVATSLPDLARMAHKIGLNPFIKREWHLNVRRVRAALLGDWTMRRHDAADPPGWSAEDAGRPRDLRRPIFPPP